MTGFPIQKDFFPNKEGSYQDFTMSWNRLELSPLFALYIPFAEPGRVDGTLN